MTQEYCGFCDYGYGDANECECDWNCGAAGCSGSDIDDDEYSREEDQEC